MQQVEPTLSDVVQIQESQHSLPVPLEVTFSVTFIQSPGASLNDVWMTCESDFGDGSQVTTEEFVLTDEHIITHTYTTFSADAQANITCSNHVSATSHTPTIIFRQPVTGLELSTSQPHYATGDDVTFTVTMTTGDYLTVEADFQDGSLAESFMVTPVQTTQYSFTHSYTLADNYSVSVNVSNEHYWSVATLTSPVIVQTIVPAFTLLMSPQAVSVPSGELTITVQLSNTLYPTSVFCDWVLNGATLATTYATALETSQTDDYTHTFTRADVGQRQDVTVTCYNLVSDETNFAPVEVFEPISGLHVDVTPPAITPGDSVTVSLSVLSGSHVVYDVTALPLASQQEAHPSLFASDGAVDVTLTYTVAGNYSVDVDATNDVSSVSESVYVMVQPMITGLSLTADAEIIWPDSDVNMLYATMALTGASTQELDDVSCAWDFGDGGTDDQYYDSISTVGTDPSVSHQYAEAAIGAQTITMNCSNLVSWQLVQHSVNIVRDDVTLASVDGGSWVYQGASTSVTATIDRFGSNACFKFSMGDGTVLLYGLPWCQATATNIGVTLNSVTSGAATVTATHVYSTHGDYIVTVTGFNHVSSGSLTAQTTVREQYCYQPNVTFNATWLSQSTPMTYDSADTFSITPDDVEVDCLRASDQYDVTWQVREVGQSTVVETQTTQTFVYTAG